MPEIMQSDQINDVYVVIPSSFGDERGRFTETYRRSWFPLGREMVQGSRSDKSQGSLVGLHYHLHQADYWYVVSGQARVALVDLRVGSKTHMNVFEITMGDTNQIGLYIPPGVAHGFAAITDVVLTYLVDGYYNPTDELGIRFDDPSIKVNWGIANPIVSDRDSDNPTLDMIESRFIPHYGLRT